MPIKICNIVGARPQFVKYGPIGRQIKHLAANSELELQDILIHTGQHYDDNMSDIFFREFGFKAPDYNLGVGSGEHGAQTAQMLTEIERVLLDEQPDLVMVYGDTNSTLAGALAAAKKHIPVAHVEAGLRSHNKAMPEEINRILTDHVSTLLFCPSQLAVQNLREEHFRNVANGGEVLENDTVLKDAAPIHVDNPLVVNVGDVMYDVMLSVLKHAEQNSHILAEMNLKRGEYCLLTIHRAENTEDARAFRELLDFVHETSRAKQVIFPAHPRTRNFIDTHGITLPDSIRLTEPVGYLDLLQLLQHCAFVLTDSGGMQKEAYWLRTPCITLRRETEWRETVDTGWNTLYAHFTPGQQPPAHHPEIYGDGRAAEKILQTVMFFLRQP